jgi:hypothetical protein
VSKNTPTLLEIIQHSYFATELVAFETQMVGKKLLSGENNMISVTPISAAVLSSCPAGKSSIVSVKLYPCNRHSVFFL